MAFDVAFNDFAITRVLSWADIDGERVSQQSRPRRHAHLLHNFAWRKFKFVTLTCESDFDTEAELEDYLENLMAAITSGIGNLTRKDTGRYLKAKYTSSGGIDDATRLPGKLRRYTLEFECEPHFYGATRSESFLSQAPGANNLVNNAGKVPAPPRIEVTGPVGIGETVTITNTTTGMGMTFTGDIVSGQSVVFDHVNGIVLKGSAIANVDVPNFWELIPGNNNIRYDGGDTASINVQWLERFNTG